MVCVNNNYKQMLTWSKCCDNKVKDNINKNISVQFNSCFPHRKQNCFSSRFSPRSCKRFLQVLSKFCWEPVRISNQTPSGFCWNLREFCLPVILSPWVINTGYRSMVQKWAHDQKKFVHSSPYGESPSRFSFQSPSLQFVFIVVNIFF